MSGPDPYLFFNGNCAEAMRFYERTLGGKIEMMMTHGQAPGAEKMQGDPNRILHARLSLDGRIFMASDAMEGHPYEGMHGFSLSLTYATVAEGKKIFSALSEGGQVRMPFDKTFWVEAFGMCVDRFGTPWMINAGKPAM